EPAVLARHDPLLLSSTCNAGCITCIPATDSSRPPAPRVHVVFGSNSLLYVLCGARVGWYRRPQSSENIGCASLYVLPFSI
ncbi:hypothetical protein EDB85DRAFT_2292657, partial [Lactarius pseudohatsudake]